ncbi:uncharacterized protein LOC119080810 [Bradysia coprophila]|uniref:uncharacterized protein LOC119080810 n=1 Tax=Bradysia coprophila TaxID=38358 RepID=UPI00187DD53C|nr:uncharacterized protein LOC119080810 [Bradysia coprophila]
MEVDMDPVVVTPANISVDTDVEMSIEGAPPNLDHVYAIVPPMPQTPFPITRPSVNVKAITRQCLEIICALEAAGGEPTFGEVYRQLEADGETRTPALVFSSILELASSQPK